MTVIKEIEAAEERYKGKLENFFLRKWGETYLPSHDLSHHRRVWNFARELLEVIDKRPKAKPVFSTDKLLMACFLHDLGLSSCRGPLHGAKSSNLCREFLVENNLPPSEYNDVISAVKNHDRKENRSHEKQKDLSTILSAADDLDAMGLTGIYRYSEIYLARGIPAGILGLKVIENARIRFENFESIFCDFRELTDNHRRRYLVLKKFFEEYNKQSKECHSGEIPSGPCGIIDVIKKLISSATNPEEFVRFSKRVTVDRSVHKFFESLKKEMHISENHSNRSS